MPLKLETKLQLVGNTGTLITSIPKPIAKHFELKKGDKMNIYIKGNHIVLEKQEWCGSTVREHDTTVLPHT